LQGLFLERLFKRLGALRIGRTDGRITQGIKGFGGFVRDFLQELVAVIRIIICDQEFRVFLFVSRVIWLEAQNFFPGLAGFFGVGGLKFKSEIAQDFSLLTIQGIEGMVNRAGGLRGLPCKLTENSLLAECFHL